LLPSENQPVDEVVPARLLVIRYFCALAFVIFVGVAAWWITDNDNEEESDFIKSDQDWWIIQLLGWSSALLFVRAFPVLPELTDLISSPLQLGARIPQISQLPLYFFSIPMRSIRTLVKNFKSRCAGLSPALFFFALFGNTTYALSICAKSMDKDYLIKNGGWLAGRIPYR
jgi:hypothetical protein